MIHGYCKILNNKALLAFAESAPILEKSNSPLYKLVEATESDDVVGYSVVTSDVRGFLWYDEESAKAEADHFTELFNKPYRCVPLKVDYGTIG